MFLINIFKAAFIYTDTSVGFVETWLNTFYKEEKEP